MEIAGTTEFAKSTESNHCSGSALWWALSLADLQVPRNLRMIVVGWNQRDRRERSVFGSFSW